MRPALAEHRKEFRGRGGRGCHRGGAREGSKGESRGGTGRDPDGSQDRKQRDRVRGHGRTRVHSRSFRRVRRPGASGGSHERDWPGWRGCAGEVDPRDAVRPRRRRGRRRGAVHRVRCVRRARVT